MGLIKNADLSQLRQYSLADIEARGEAILEHARKQAAAILTQAREQAELLKQQASEQGHAEGLDQGTLQGLAEGQQKGYDEALAQHSQRFSQLAEALTSGLTAFNQARVDLEAEALHDVVTLACTIARRITKRQIEIDPNVLASNLAEIMSMVVHAADVRIAIHPDEQQSLEQACESLSVTFPQLAHAQIVTDEQISPGGCRVFTAGGELNADVEQQLMRIIGELLPAPNEGA